jgi:hypothetical protein
VWRQESEHGPWYSIVLTRSYKDSQGTWQNATSFGRDDLLLLAKLCDQVHTWIFREQAKDAQSQSTGKPVEREPGQDDQEIPF